MTTRGLVRKYSPQRFEDVRGQESVVSVLMQLARRGQRARDLLLHGAYGSGKTTLARLSHMSLNCQQLSNSGSPCGACSVCRTPEAHGFHSYDTPRHGGDKEHVLEWMDVRRRSPTKCNVETLFFDEAHALSQAAADGLLIAIDQAPERLAFYFATTEPDKIKPALRSRLMELEVNRLALSDAVAFVKEVAEREGIPYDDKALPVLCKLKKGHLRDLLNGLEQVANLGAVNVENIKAAFGLGRLEHLHNYFMALADADLHMQRAALEQWHDDLEFKVRCIQAYLASVYFRELSGTDVIVDPLVDSLEEGRSVVIGRFCNRLGVEDRTALIPYWAALQSFWTGGEARSDSERWLRLASFSDLACRKLGNMEPSRDQQRHPPGLVTGCVTNLERSTAEVGESVSPSTNEHGLTFIRPGDVRDIINNASFLIQHYGVLMNVEMTVVPSCAARACEASAVSVVRAFLQALNDLPTRARVPVTSIAVLERDQAGVLGRIAAYVPPTPEWDEMLAEWCRGWQHHSFGRPRVDLSVARTDPLKFHWDEVLNLCAGLSDVDAPGLLTKLKIPSNRRRNARPMQQPPVLFSPLLERASIDGASQLGMAPLSAFDDEAWGWIRRGWEVDEHADRRRTLADRQRTIEEIQNLWARDEAKCRAAIEQRLTEWNVAPRDRPRRWVSWWSRES